MIKHPYGRFYEIMVALKPSRFCPYLCDAQDIIAVLFRAVFNVLRMDVSVGAIKRKRVAGNHADEEGHELKRFEHVFNVGFSCVMIEAAAHGNRDTKLFPVQLLTLGTVCPAISQHFVLPLLKQGRRAEPVHRKLEDDATVRLDKRLFLCRIDFSVRVSRVQFMNGKFVGIGFDCIDPGFVYL